LLRYGKVSPLLLNAWLPEPMPVLFEGHFGSLPGPFVEVGLVGLLVFGYLLCTHRARQDLRSQFLLLLYIAVAGERDFSLHFPLPTILHCRFHTFTTHACEL
jgi:hypothetical protein